MRRPWVRSRPLGYGEREAFPDGMTTAAWLFHCGAMLPDATRPGPLTEREILCRDRAIALMESGECLWHATSIAFGTAGRCPCTPCRAARKAA